MPPSKQIGTLVVVVLKARNLKDSHTFYKQDPYTLIRLGGTGKQTKVDPRGGQHPLWDEELHLPVFEVSSGVDQRTLKVSVYSKESKVDDLIGEGKLNVSDTLKKGEFDDWIKLETNGAYRGEVYLEMTYYSAEPPLARRPSKLSPKDRLWRPPATPPKDTTSPYLSPQPSPQLRPSANNSPRLHPSSSPHLRPTPAAAVPSSSPPRQEPARPSPRQEPTRPSPRQEPVRHAIPTTSPPRQPYIDPTLKNIPFLDVGPPASGSGAPNPPQPAPPAALYSVPSILRPRNVKSSPIPVHTRDEPPPIPPRKQDDPNRRFQQELADSDAAFAAQLAQSEGIDVERLRAEEADAELARRLEADERAVPGGWVGD